MKRLKEPKYQMVASELRRRIAAGEVGSHELLCTERSLCEQYDISRITAKRAVALLEEEDLIYRRRGAGSFVKENAAESLWAGETRSVLQNIALVIPFSITKGGLFKMLEGATDILSEAGFFFSLHVSHNDRETLTNLQRIDMKGLVYYPAFDISTYLLDYFSDRNIPVIVLDKPHDYPQYSSITCDNATGQAMLAEHIIAYGHVKTAYLSRSAKLLSSVRDRFMSYVNVLEASGGRIPRFVQLDSNNPLNQDVMRHIIITLRKEGITALLCENDAVALCVLACCRSLGLQVPLDISITGFDNIEWSLAGEAQITTIDQNFSGIGAEIAQLLINAPYRPKQIKVPVSFVPRSSTGLPSG